QDGPLDLQRVHQGQDVQGERGLVHVPRRRGGQERGTAVAAEVRDDHPVAAGRQQRCDLDVAVDVVGEAVHENDRAATGRAGLDVAYVQHAGVDLFHRAEGRAG